MNGPLEKASDMYAFEINLKNKIRSNEHIASLFFLHETHSIAILDSAVIPGCKYIRLN